MESCGNLRGFSMPRVLCSCRKPVRVGSTPETWARLSEEILWVYERVIELVFLQVCWPCFFRQRHWWRERRQPRLPSPERRVAHTVKEYNLFTKATPSGRGPFMR